MKSARRDTAGNACLPPLVGVVQHGDGLAARYDLERRLRTDEAEAALSLHLAHSGQVLKRTW